MKFLVDAHLPYLTAEHEEYNVLITLRRDLRFRPGGPIQPLQIVDLCQNRERQGASRRFFPGCFSQSPAASALPLTRSAACRQRMCPPAGPEDQPQSLLTAPIQILAERDREAAQLDAFLKELGYE